MSRISIAAPVALALLAASVSTSASAHPGGHSGGAAHAGRAPEAAPARSAPADAAAAADAAPAAGEAFEKLKSLAGDWKAESPAMPGVPLGVTWRVTAGGTAVMETLFAGSPHEMVSVYFLDGDILRMTHYCAAGNQPRMKYDPKASSASDLAFAFDGGSGFDPAKDFHIHEGRVTFGKDGVSESWTGWDGGKEADVKEIRLVTKR